MDPFYYTEEILFGVLTGLASSVPSLLFGIAGYVLTALALQTLAQRRGLNKPWLAWVPVLNIWLVGSLSDQYRYVVKGENKSKRKWLLGLRMISSVLTLVCIILAIVIGAGAIHFMGYNPSQRELLQQIMGPALGIAGVGIALAGISIAYAVIRYMALYDVYKSMDPANCVVFLVLSILFHVSEPFFLFFCRNKDKGMPPRREQPVYEQPQQPQWQQEEPQQNFWEQDTQNADYL